MCVLGFCTTTVPKQEPCQKPLHAICAGLGGLDELTHTDFVKHTDSLEWMTPGIDLHTARYLLELSVGRACR